MTLKVFALILALSQVASAKPLDFNELRLQLMAKVMNSRDFDLMIYALREIEVLDRACAKELELKRLPIHCFQLQETIKSRNLDWPLNFSFTEVECAQRVASLSEDELMAINKNTQYLPKPCQQQIFSRMKIVQYKKSGKRFE